MLCLETVWKFVCLFRMGCQEKYRFWRMTLLVQIPCSYYIPFLIELKWSQELTKWVGETKNHPLNHLTKLIINNFYCSCKNHFFFRTSTWNSKRSRHTFQSVLIKIKIKNLKVLIYLFSKYIIWCCNRNYIHYLAAKRSAIPRQWNLMSSSFTTWFLLRLLPISAHYVNGNTWSHTKQTILSLLSIKILSRTCS